MSEDNSCHYLKLFDARGAETPLEALLTLNTVVLLRDGKPGYEFNVTASSVKAKDAEISRRLQYLAEKPRKS
jgi:hypothetical protein